MPNDTALLFRVLAFGLGSNGTATMRPRKPNTKVMFNWVHFMPDRKDTTGSGATAKTWDLDTSDAFVVSFRIDF